MSHDSSLVLTRQLTCIVCGELFTVTVVIAGSGSAGAFRRKFCSKSCKQVHHRKSNSITDNVVFCVCLFCGKAERVFASLAKNRKTCSRACSYAYRKLTTVAKLLDKTCVVCNDVFKVNPKFWMRETCGLKCSLSSRRTCVSKSCEVCGNPFFEKASQLGKHRFCSRPCQFKAQSDGRVKIHINGRSGRRIDLGDDVFRSSFEADYARVCRHFNVDYVYQSMTFPWGEGKWYTPDFYHPKCDLYIELKGVQNSASTKFSAMLTKNLAAHQELINRGVKIFTIYMADFYRFIKQVGVYDTLPNLEHRNYAGTRHLVCDNSRS